MLAVGCNTGEADGDGGGGGEGDSTSTMTTTTSPTTTNATENDSLGTMGGSMGQLDSSGTAAVSTTTGATGTTGDPTTGDSTTGDPTTGEPVEGCGSVDFLFVIDNSGSMSAQQTQLLASFPGFIQAITASLGEAADSYHVGVVTSDAYEHNEPGCTGIGNLVTQTGGLGSSEQDCSPLLTPGNRFATEMDDLEMAFNCMAQVGTDGSGIEQPVTATIAALEDAGACNAGFLRDEAILVVVVITDDPPWDPDVDDAHPSTDTTMWYDDVVAAKNGDPEAMVVVGFVPWMNTTCVFQNLESPNLISFVEDFGDQGLLASICEPDFGPALADAVATIVTTCEEF